MIDKHDDTDFDNIERRLKEVERELQGLKREAQERDMRQLKWGVRVLGALVITMAGWIWSQVGHMFDLGGK